MKISGLLALPVAGVSAAAVEDGLYKRQDVGLVYTTEVGGETVTTSVPGLATTLELEASETVWTAEGLTSELSVSAGQVTSVVVSEKSEAVVLPGTSTQVVLSEDSLVELVISDHETTIYAHPGAATREGEIDGAATDADAIEVTVKGTTTTVQVTGATTIDFVVPDVSTDIVYSGTTIVLSASSGAAKEGESGLTSGVTIEGTTVTVSRQGTTIEGSLDGTLVEVSVAPEEVTVTVPSSYPATEPTSIVPTHYPMECVPQLAPVSGEQKAMLGVLFQTDDTGTTFAEYLSEYAENLVSQMWMISNDALNLGGLTFTSLFTEVDITGILGLASAAPIYTCMLSSVWSEAVADQGAMAKRDVPTPEEEAKLIALFQRREDGGNGYDLVELLIDETDQMISQINEALPVAATNADFITAFPQLDVRQLLSVVSDAPIYTQTVSSLFVSALSVYSETVVITTSSPTTTSTTSRTSLRPVTVYSTTRTFTTAYSYSTNYMSGTVTVPTTVLTTRTSVSIGPFTVTLRTTSTDMRYFTETFYSIEELGRVGNAADDLPTITTVVTSNALGVPVGETRWVTVTVGGRGEGSTVRVTEIVGAPNTQTGPAGGVRGDGYGNTVTTTTVRIDGQRPEQQQQQQQQQQSVAVTVTRAPADDNRITTIVREQKGETKDITVVREGDREVTINSARDGVMYYTRVIDGQTRTFSIAMQTVNGALKKVVGLGAGLMGLAALVL